MKLGQPEMWLVGILLFLLFAIGAAWGFLLALMLCSH